MSINVDNVRRRKASVRYEIESAEDFGRAIGEFRALRQLSQADLAEAVGIHRSYLSEFESGQVTDALRRLVALAARLDLTIELRTKS